MAGTGSTTCSFGFMLHLLQLLLLGKVKSEISLRGSGFHDTDVVIEDMLRKNTSVSHGNSRRVQESTKFFRPLDCNVIKCSKGTTTWKKLGLDPAANPVVIPCGTCVTMDFDSSPILELAYGLDIQGTLIFLSGYRLILRTPFVLVQGNLDIFSSRAVSDKPDVVFQFAGKNTQSFIPAANNKFVCSADGASSPSKCIIGFKAFVVAGGKVTIRGLNGTCATWTKLYDIARGNLPISSTFESLPVNFDRSSNLFCHSWRYMEEAFSRTDNLYGWTGGYGAYFKIANGTFLVSGRKSSLDHGPTWDMLWVRSCLIPRQKYLFSARVRLSKFGANVGDKTACAASNQNCLMLISSVGTIGGGINRPKKVWETAQDIRLGQWYGFYAAIEFDEDELSPDNVYQILRLRGPEVGVDIELDDVRFSLPDPKTLPDPFNVCGGNLIPNGDAEAHPIHPYPISTFGGYLSVEAEDNGNHYFHHSGRNLNSHSPIYVFTALGCFAVHARYKISVSLRIDSDFPIDILIKIRSDYFNSTTLQKNLFECRGVTRAAWKVCIADISLSHVLLGGKVKDIRLQFETIGAANMDMDVDDLKVELVDASITSLIVSSAGVIDCWSKGSDVLITSHTLNYEDSQVRTIAAIPTNLGNGFVRLDLNESIVQPISQQDSHTFAVEVALLSRNILFRGEDDPLDSLMGAHFMVMQTPNVAQLIDGAEFRNFGQQGTLGRYPIHFHLCGDVQGAIVKRNSIRNSKQRCVVIHGSNGVFILDNIAFDTRGHCYMLEDGGEVGNVFRRNLGANTLKATRPVSSSESDHLLPSTFWCSNPKNSWIENVAAGSSDSGFWFELRDAVRGPTASMPLSKGMIPRRMELGAFTRNTAHSNGKHGIRTYPHGYLPSIEAVFSENLCYRNFEDGFFLHNSKNIAITGGMLADNAIQIDIDRAHAIRVEGTSLVGMSDAFRTSITSKAGVASHFDTIVGIQLHGKTFFDEGGTQIRSVEFSGFENTGSNYVALIDVDDEATNQSFDYPVSISDVKIEGDVAQAHFDFSKALASGVDDIYIIDLTSSMKPRYSIASGVSSIVANSNVMKTFLSMKECEIFSTSGYMYCANTCIRTMVYSINPSMTEHFKLRITNSAGRYVDIRGGYNVDAIASKNDWFQKQRTFVASLPIGTYKAYFHTGDGRSIWPTHAEEFLMNALCESSIESQNLQLEVPAVSTEDCEELVKNGNLEDSLLPNFWLQSEGGMEVISKAGIDATNAISDVIQSTASGSLGQFLDTRCLKRGRQYEVHAWLKLTVGSSIVSCDSATQCPVLRLLLRSPGNFTASYLTDIKLDISSAFVRPYNSSGWNLLHGTFAVDTRIQTASSVAFFVERQRIGARMTLDNVSIRPLQKDCSQLIFNGDFTEGTSRFWVKSASKDSLILAVKKIADNWALELSGRSSQSDSPQQDIRVKCLLAGSRFIATARFKLLKSDGSILVCNPSFVTGERACPRMILRSLIDTGLPTQSAATRVGGSVAVTDHQMTPDGWYTMSGVFTASTFDEQADSLKLSWDQLSEQGTFVVDNISITPLPKNCEELILNGDIEYDTTARFWRMWINGGGKIAQLNDGPDNHVLLIYNRMVEGDGIYQFVDPICMNRSDVWRFSARMKITSVSSGLGVACQPGVASVSNACPRVRITGWIGSSIVVENTLSMTSHPTWLADSYNEYVTSFIVDSILASCDRIAIGIRQYNLDWDLFVDDVSVTPQVV